MPEYNSLNLAGIDQAAQRTNANNFQQQEVEKASRRTDQEYDDETKLRNTRMVYGSTKVLMEQYGTDNFEPAFAELSQRGVADGWLDQESLAQIQEGGVTFEEIADLNKSAEIALAGRPSNAQMESSRQGKSWVNPDTETMWSYINGVPTDSGVPAQQYADKYIETGDGTLPVNPGGTGNEGRAIVPGTDPASMSGRAANEAAAIEKSKSDVKTHDEYIQLQQQNRDAYQIYEVARNGMMAGLEGSTTGYWAGKIPPMTAAQQKAAGGVAALAPVLKQLFRAAGEGIFTDKDQELLMQMLPTRDTLPEARAGMIENIDIIVRYKLGMADFETLQKARAAIQSGAPEDKVKQRLEAMGIDPRKL